MRLQPAGGPDLGGLADLRIELRAVLAAMRLDVAATASPKRRSQLVHDVVHPQSPSPAPVTPPQRDPRDDVMAIVGRAQAGDAEAFGELYDRYVDLIYRYVYYRVGNKVQAEDFVSETFLRALRRITSFSWQGRDFAAWLVTIARNLIADHYKSGRYRLEVTTAEMLDADRAEDSPESAVLDSLTNETLLDAVRRLGGEQQECIVLRFLQGMSVTETALAMGKTDGAIKALQYRAVRTLSRLLPREMVL
jgi:RNA polymerase sigma-70 factor (ECF subfamily)